MFRLPGAEVETAGSSRERVPADLCPHGDKSPVRAGKWAVNKQLHPEGLAHYKIPSSPKGQEMSCRMGQHE